MTREEQKTRDVVLARYGYRHEAEFAAGFLDDAGIPFRLQIDDPAMGLTIAAPATLWVRAMDLQRAQELLDIDTRPTAPRPTAPTYAQPPRRPTDPARRDPKPTAPSGRVGSVPGREASGQRSGDALSGVPSGTGLMPGPQLSYRERGLALAASAGLASSAPFARDAGLEGLVVGVVVAASGLFLVAAFGRAPSFLRGLLRNLSGSAP